MRRLHSLRPGLLVALLNRAGAKDARIAELEAEVNDLKAELVWQRAVLDGVQETLPPQPGMMRSRLAKLAAARGGIGGDE